MKRNQLILASICVIAGLILFSVSLHEGGQHNTADAPTLKLPQTSSESNPSSVAKGSSLEAESASEHDNMLDAFREHLPEDQRGKAVLLNGGEVALIKGGKIEEDSNTGAVKVVGFAEIEFTDGNSIKGMSPKTSFEYDPVKNRIKLVGSTRVDIKSRPPPPPANAEAP